MKAAESDASAILQSLLASLGLPSAAGEAVDFGTAAGNCRTSFAVGAMAQASIAAAAVAANELGACRGIQRRQLSMNLPAVERECAAWFRLNGVEPGIWDKFSGLYQAGEGWLRIHTNFAHHRDGALRLLGLRADTAERADVQERLKRWKALDFEQAAAEAGLVATALRSFQEWDVTDQGRAVAGQPLFSLEPLDSATVPPLPAADAEARPLAGIRVLDLTRILAGPTCARVLATYGADVMMVSSPNLPHIEAVAETSRGKRSVSVDLETREGRETLSQLVRGAHVLIQGYRPGGLAARGFGPVHLADLRPGLVCVSLSAYGSRGPWSGRRGFDSLTQTCMGLNMAEGLAFAAAGGEFQPRALPFQALDYATGFLMAACVSAALRKQQDSGGSWLAELSLAQSAYWLRSLGQAPFPPAGDTSPEPSSTADLEVTETGFGRLEAIRHSVSFDGQYWSPDLASMPPGTHAPEW